MVILQLGFGCLFCVLSTEASGLLNAPFQTAIISHSGPWDDQHSEPSGAEKESGREKRAIYRGRGYWGGRTGAAYSYGGAYTYGGYAGSGYGSLIASIPPDGYLKSWITSEHNRYRRMIPATDMRMMYWSEELAASAQRHANTCDFRHSRFRVNIGENIWAAPYHNYSDAIWRWYNEVNNPWCACNNGFKSCCGHYIQLVWARTNLVGCGYAQCNSVIGVGSFGRAVFVCHYNPQGNKVSMSGSAQLVASPAFTWAYDEGQRCRDCPSDQPACHEGLCYMPLNYRPSSYGYNRTRYGDVDRNTVDIRKR